MAESTSARMAPESCRWKNERIANVGYLEPIPRGSLRPEAATDLHDQFKWNIHWSAREESHDDGPSDA